MSVWANFDTVGIGDNGLFGHGTSSSNNGLHLVERNAKLYFGFYGSDLVGVTLLSTNEWYNIVFVFDYITKRKTIYLNGEFESSRIQENYSGTGTFYIGTSIGGNSKLEGKMDTAKIYNKALTENEVVQNFNALRGRYGI